MDPVFSIGISSLWDELRHMPAGGVWWFNVDRHEDAISLANQTIASQAETAHVAVISMDSDPAKIFQLDDSQGPEKITLFSMLNHEKGLYYLARDLQCSIDPHNYLFILVCANNAWQNIPAERLRSWLDKMNKWSRLNHCSLLVINSGNNNDKQFSLLLEEYRSLFGLASLRFQGDQHLLDIAFWCNEKGVSARQQLSVQQQNGCWTLVQHQEAEIQPRSDEKRIPEVMLAVLGRCAAAIGTLATDSTITKSCSMKPVPLRRRRWSFLYSKMRKSSHWPAAFILCVASAVVR